MATFLRERGFLAGYAAMLFGVTLLVAGFGIDAYLHSRDPDLAEREGVFTTSNPGHLLVVIGLACTILGAFIGPYTRWVLARRSVVLSALVPAIALAAAVSISAVFALTINDLDHGDEHGHADQASVETAADTAGGSGVTTAAGGERGHDAAVTAEHGSHALPILPRHLATVALEESTFHEPSQQAAVTEENMRFAEQFLAGVKLETAKYQDVSVAEAEGYTRITPDLPLIGAHFYNAQYVGSLAPGHPGIILYQSDGAGGWKLAGLAYMIPKVPGIDTPPDTQLGGLAQWHYHTNLCFSPGNVTIAVDGAHCGGLFIAETPWLLHVWAWKDSPEGVFNHANSLLQ
ncbi:MAG: hypothetical protein Q7T33_09985 [Dehalococcoidia bacterium]|nr:hypothetical protein [Dehalococcoidia bacterium]